MSKKCARCEKVVYPTEELKCLDKVWHKACFKCQECGMALSMKTYKGFNKMPYCEAHIPKAKATTVAETPEMKRLAENTKIQSNVQYHAEFEKTKSKFTQIADDPETMRLKQNSKIISNVAYHGELEKKAQMEMKRSDPQQDSDAPAAPPLPVSSYENRPAAQHQPPQQQVHHPPPQQPHQAPPSQTYRAGAPSHASYGSTNAANSPPYHPQSVPSSYPAHLSYHHSQSHHHPASNVSNTTFHQHGTAVPQNLYQDANHNSPYSSRNSQTLIYSSQTGPVQHNPGRQVGSIADYDPMNHHYGSVTSSRNYQPPGGYRQDTGYQPQHSTGYPDSRVQQQQQHHMNPPSHHKVNAPPTQLGCFRAMYDYEAADADEVSFRDGDLIINCTPIDDGWMTGTVQRTGRVGMLPANYVERVS